MIVQSQVATLEDEVRRLLFGAAALALAGIVQAQTLRADPYVTGLSSPTAMIQDPTLTNVQYVVQQGGTIRVVQNGALVGTNFIDISSRVLFSGERGLLGLAFPSNYSTTGFFYVDYVNTSGNTQISRFSRSTSNPLTADPNSELKLLTISQPFDNHKGGCVRFGPDGMLYIGMGDGGSGNDPNNNAQNPNSLLGKILRIDPTSDDFPADPNKNYHIPANNPFLDGVPISAAGEIWDFGVRNPWKYSFDTPALGGTGALIIADVGQGAWEEVDYEAPNTGGKNYGWRVREGAHSILGGTPAFTPLVDPIFEYSHSTNPSLSITGGYIYRGSDLGAGFLNRYFFADYVSGQTWSFLLTQAGGSATSSNLIEHTAEIGNIGFISSIDQDAAGEQYIVRYSSPATIYRIRPFTAPNSTVVPSAFNIFRGNLVSGGVANVAASDDSRLAVSAGPVAMSSEAPIMVEFTGTAPNATASLMSLVVEAQSNNPNLSELIDVFDWVSNSYVSLDSYAPPTNSDRVRLLPIPNPNRFIQSGTRAVKCRVRLRQTGPIATSPYQLRLDQIQWRIWN